jgi:hypothetical protein
VGGRRPRLPQDEKDTTVSITYRHLWVKMDGLPFSMIKRGFPRITSKVELKRQR